jgi:hypothetical protein
MPSVRRFLILLLATGAYAGCFSPAGPKLAPVSGRVTFDGKPLDRATVMFQPVEGRPSFGTTDQDGRYTMQYTIERLGVMPRTSTVSITTVVEDDQGGMVRREFLPPKYHSQTELSAKVEPKANVFDFNLVSK